MTFFTDTPSNHAGSSRHHRALLAAGVALAAAIALGGGVSAYATADSATNASSSASNLSEASNITPPPSKSEPLVPATSPSTPLLDSTDTNSSDTQTATAEADASLSESEPAAGTDSPSISTLGDGTCGITKVNTLNFRFTIDGFPDPDVRGGKILTQETAVQMCVYHAYSTTQFRYSNGTATQGDTSQNITLTNVAFPQVKATAYVKKGYTVDPSKAYTIHCFYNEAIGTTKFSGTIYYTGLSKLTKSSQASPSMNIDTYNATCPAAVGAVYQLNGNYPTNTSVQPSYNQVYAPNIPGYDITVTNGTYNPTTRMVTIPNPVNTNGTPVYGNNLMNATNAITTITYHKAAANATIHWNINGTENTNMQQTFNGYQDDPLNTVLATRIPAGYYAQPASPGLSCNDSTCTINTTYQPGHTDYWINCSKLITETQTKTQTRTIHYQYQHDHTQAAPDQVDTITWTRTKTTNPVTGTTTYTNWTTTNTNDGTTKTTGYYPQANSPHLDGWTTTTPTTQAQTTLHTDGTPAADPTNPTSPTDPQLTNRTTEITIFYIPSVKALPFTGTTTNTTTITLTGLVVAVVLVAVSSILRRHHNSLSTR